MADINFKVGFGVDKTGLNSIKKELADISKQIEKNESKGLISPEMTQKSIAQIQKMEKALEKAFDTETGVLNVKKLNRALKDSETTLDGVQKAFRDAGVSSGTLFQDIQRDAIKSGVEVKKTATIIDKMADTLGQTVKWNLASGAINEMTGQIQRAVGFVKSLDESLTQIRIVTGKSSTEMQRFSEDANKAAKALGRSTTEYTDASLIFFQQGKTADEVRDLTEATLAGANVTGMEAAQTAELLTAVMNGYQIEASEAMEVTDKLAAVGAATGSDFQEMAEAMSKVSSQANSAGVSIDQLGAMISTVSTVTREAPTIIGTSFKTILGRLADIQNGKEVDSWDTGKVEDALNKVGMSVLDQNGKLREAGDILNELGAKWSSLNKESQVGVAKNIAGLEQYNRLVALMENWPMYQEAFDVSMNASGATMEQNAIRMDSLQAKTNALRSETERLYMALSDEEAFKGLIGGFTSVVSKVADLAEGIGGLDNILMVLGGTAANVFNKQIGKGIDDLGQKISKSGQKIKDAFTRSSGEEQLKASEVNAMREAESSEGKQVKDVSVDIVNKRIELRKQEERLAKSLTEEEMKGYSVIKDQIMAEQESMRNKVTERQNKIKEAELVAHQYDEELSTIEQINEAESRAQVFTSQKEKELEREKAIRKEILDMMSQNQGSLGDELDNFVLGEAMSEAHSQAQEFLRTNGLIEQAIDGQISAEEALLAALDETNQAIVDRNDELEESVRHQEALATLAQEQAGEEVDLGAETENIANLEAEAEQLEKVAERREKINKAVQGLGVAVGIYGAVSDSLKVLTDETASAEDKTNALNSALKGAGAVLISSGNPYAMAAGAVAMLAGTFVQLAHDLDPVNRLMEKNAETLENYKTRMKDLKDEQANVASSTQKMAEAEAMAADGLNPDEYEEYHGILNDIADTTPRMVEYYDAYGNAVLKTKEEVDEYTDSLVKLQKVENDRMQQMSGNFATEIAYLQTTEAERKKSLESKLETQQAELDQLMADGASVKKIDKKRSAIDETLMDLEEIKTKFAEVQQYAQDALINPFIQGEDIFKDLGQEMQGFAAGLFNAEDVTKGIEDLANKGIYSTEQLKTKTQEFTDSYKEGVLKVADAFVSVKDQAKWGGEEAQKFVQQLEGLDQRTQGAIGESLLGFSSLGVEGDQLIEVVNNISRHIDETGKLNAFTLMEDFQNAATQIQADLEQAFEQSKNSLIEKFNDISSGGFFGGLAGELTMSDYFNQTTGEYMEGALELTDAIKEGNGMVVTAMLEDSAELRERTMEQLQLLAEQTSMLTGESTDKAMEAQAMLDVLANLDAEIEKREILNQMSSDENDLYDTKLEKIWATNEGAEMMAETWNAMIEATSELGEDGLFSVDVAALEEQNDALREKTEIIAETVGASEELAEATEELAESDEQLASSAKGVGEAFKKMEGAMGKDMFDRLIDMTGATKDELESLAQQAASGSVEAARKLQNEMGRVYAAMRSQDTAYYQDFVRNNSARLADVQRVTGISANEYQNLAQYNADLERWVTQVGGQENFERLVNFSGYIQSQLSAASGAANKTVEINNVSMSASEAGAVVAALSAAKAAVEAGKAAGQGGKAAANEFIDALATSDSAVAAALGGIKGKLKDAGDDYNAVIAVIDAEIAKVKGSIKDATGVDLDLDLGNWKPKPINFGGGGSIKPPSRPSSGGGSGGGGSGPGVGGGGGGKPSGGGGGKKPSGGKGDKEEEEKEIEDLEWEADIYRDINHELELQDRLLDDLKKQQDKLTGKELLENLEKQRKVMQQQQKLYERKLEMQKKDLANQKAEVQKTSKDTLGGGELKFDESGYITNYNEVLEKKRAYVNSLKGEAKEKAKEDFDAFVKMLDDYEEKRMNEVYETEQALKESIEAEREIWLQEFEYNITVQLEIRAEVESMIEFQIDTNKDPEDIAENMGLTQELIDNKIGELSEVYAQIEKVNAAFAAGEITEKERAEYMKEYIGQLKDIVKDLQKLEEQMTKLFKDGLKAGLKPLEEHMKSFEKINKELGHMEKMLKLIGEGDNFEMLDKIYEERADAINGQIDLMTKQKSSLEAQRDALEAAGMKGSEEWWAVQDAIEKTNDSINKLAEEGVKNLQNQFKNAIDSIMDSLEQDMTGGLGMDGLKDQNKKEKDERKKYLDQEERLLAVTKLQSKYQKEIDATDDPAKKAKLQKMMESELAALKEKDKLTKYDIDRANQIYDITMKQMALDDQKAAKNTMRLVRDSQGNWVYEFTEDAKAIEKAQEDLTNSLEKLNQMDKDRLEKTQDEMLKLQEQYFKDVDKLMKDAMAGKYKTEEEFNAALDELTKQFNADMEQAHVDFEEAKLNTTISSMGLILEIYRTTDGELLGLTENQQIIMEKLATGIGKDFGELQESMKKILTGDPDSIEKEFEKLAKEMGVDAEDLKNTLGVVTTNIKKDWNIKTGEMMSDYVGSGGLKEKVTSTVDSIKDKWVEYKTKLAEVTKATGTDLDSMKDKIEDIDKATEDLTNQTDDYIARFDKFMTGITSITTAFQAQKKAIQDLIDKVKEYIKSLEEAEIKKKQESVTPKPTNPAPKPDTSKPSGGGGSGGSGGNTGGSGSGSGGDLSIGAKVRVKSGRRWYHDSAGMNPSGPTDPYSNRDLQITTRKLGAKLEYNVGQKSGEYLGWLKKTDLVGFDTGGYTGAWGKEGKMAMLHEKEIVLNKEDTKNILDAVRSTRGIGTGTMDRIRDTLAMSLNKVADSLASIADSIKTSATTPDRPESMIQQNVEINADFSGVRNAEEIEKAFENMENMASQYANRK